MSDMLSPSGATDLTSLFVAVGRIEEKFTAMNNREERTSERLEKIDNRLTVMETTIAREVKPKTPWWTVVGGVGGIVVIIINTIVILNWITQSGTIGQ